MKRPQLRHPGWILIGCTALVVCGLWSGTSVVSAARATERAMRVLLVGNSYTQANLMPQLLRRLSESAAGRSGMQVDAVVRGGFTLRNHLEQGEAAARIRRGEYHMVVLQGHSLNALNDPDELHQSIRRFDRMIERSGAQTVLYATWPRHPGALFYRTQAHVRSFGDMANLVNGEYARLAGRLKTRLAPVGRAFAKALHKAPSLTLYQADGSHPTPTGSLLAACVLYGTLTGHDPRGTTYRPPSVSAHEARLVRKVASETLRSPGRANRTTLARGPDRRLSTGARASARD